MTEQTQTYRLPGDAERGESFGNQSPELIEARAAAQSSANIRTRGDLREVRTLDPEARIDLNEEDSTGAFWRQQEAEERLLERREYQAKLSQTERYTLVIDKLTPTESVAEIADIGQLIVNCRVYKAAA